MAVLWPLKLLGKYAERGGRDAQVGRDVAEATVSLTVSVARQDLSVG